MAAADYSLRSLLLLSVCALASSACVAKDIQWPEQSICSDHGKLSNITKSCVCDPGWSGNSDYNHPSLCDCQVNRSHLTVVWFIAAFLHFLLGAFAAERAINDIRVQRTNKGSSRSLWQCVILDAGTYNLVLTAVDHAFLYTACFLSKALLPDATIGNHWLVTILYGAASSINWVRVTDFAVGFLEFQVKSALRSKKDSAATAVLTRLKRASFAFKIIALAINWSVLFLLFAGPELQTALFLVHFLGTACAGTAINQAQYRAALKLVVVVEGAQETEHTKAVLVRLRKLVKNLRDIMIVNLPLILIMLCVPFLRLRFEYFFAFLMTTGGPLAPFNELRAFPRKRPMLAGGSTGGGQRYATTAAAAASRGPPVGRATATVRPLRTAAAAATVQPPVAAGAPGGGDPTPTTPPTANIAWADPPAPAAVAGGARSGDLA